MTREAVSFEKVFHWTKFWHSLKSGPETWDRDLETWDPETQDPETLDPEIRVHKSRDLGLWDPGKRDCGMALEMGP